MFILGCMALSKGKNRAEIYQVGNVGLACPVVFKK
jgi:hypothetical protein